MNSDNLITRTSSDIIIEPLVSIIVMTYNSSAFVLKTLESAEAQTYRNIELIVTDDCSSDDTVRTAESWLKEHGSRFVRSEIITTPANTGIPANCNRGVRSSEGEWVKIIAGDDILNDNCISLFAEAAGKNPEFRFIASEMEYINAEGQTVIERDSRYAAIRGYFFSLSLEEQLKMYARFPLFLNSPSFFMHKPALGKVNYFDEEFRIYDDLPLIFKLLESGVRIDHINSETVKYRIYENSLSRTGNKETSAVRLKEQAGCFKKYRKKYLSRLNPVDITVMYDFWLEHNYRGFLGIKMLPLMYLFNFYQKYLDSLAGRYEKSLEKPADANRMP